MEFLLVSNHSCIGLQTALPLGRETLQNQFRLVGISLGYFWGVKMKNDDQKYAVFV